MVLSKATSAPGRVVSEIPLTGRDVSAQGPSGSLSLVPPSEPDSDATSLLCWVHPEWRQRFPWLAQGITGRGPEGNSGDFRLFESEGRTEAEANWRELVRLSGFPGVLHACQVHGNEILVHDRSVSGLVVESDADGHLSERAGVLMCVTVADCVPVSLVDPHRRCVAILHAGWRSAAMGILRGGVRLMVDRLETSPENLLVHLGPSICERCYEVGPEVHTALGLPEPESPTPVDLRGVLADQALNLGVLPAHVTRSSFCTRCSGSPFFSHRGGETRRQVAFLGIRPT